MHIRKYSVPINFILFELCWFGSVLGAAHHIGWLGPLLVSVLIPAQIYWLTEKYKAELFFVLLCGFIGFILETVLINLGVYTPLGSEGVQICPPWMVALWVNFGMLVSLSLSWLKGKYFLAALLGGVAGPLAWWGGQKLDALTMADTFTRGYLPLGFAWAVMLPFLVYLYSRLTAVE